MIVCACRVKSNRPIEAILQLGPLSTYLICIIDTIYLRNRYIVSMYASGTAFAHMLSSGLQLLPCGMLRFCSTVRRDLAIFAVTS